MRAARGGSPASVDAAPLPLFEKGTRKGPGRRLDHNGRAAVLAHSTASTKRAWTGYVALCLPAMRPGK